VTWRALGFFGAAAGAALLGAEAATLPPGVRLLSDVAYLPADRAEKLDIYLPPERSGGGADHAAPANLRAAIVYFHGGGWVRGDKADARERNIGGHLAAAGYVFVSTNYLLGAQAWPRNLQDCKNAVRFLRAHAAEYGVDPERIAAMGTSAGGHLALMVAYTGERGPAEFEPAAPYPKTSSAVCAVIDFYGMTDLLSRRVVEADGTPTGRFMDSHSPEVLGVSRAEGAAVWKNASPVTHVTKTSPPTLIVHGLADPTVDYVQSVQLANVLRAHGVAHELLLLEGIGHQFSFDFWQEQLMPAHVKPAVLAFAAKHLDNAPARATK
jgi:acetyl esterase/lipase